MIFFYFIAVEVYPTRTSCVKTLARFVLKIFAFSSNLSINKSFV